MFKNLGRITERQNIAKLDAKDRKILALIAENARVQASEIAKKVLLSRDTVAYRINKLQEEGVILSFFPLIDISRFGYSTYHVFLLLNERAKSQHEALLSYLIQHPNTRTVMGYTDTWDVEWTLIAKDLKEFDAILTDVLTKYPEAILEKEKLATIARYASILLPYSYHAAAGISPQYEKREKGVTFEVVFVDPIASVNGQEKSRRRLVEPGVVSKERGVELPKGGDEGEAQQEQKHSAAHVSSFLNGWVSIPNLNIGRQDFNG